MNTRKYILKYITIVFLMVSIFFVAAFLWAVSYMRKNSHTYDPNIQANMNTDYDKKDVIEDVVTEETSEETTQAVLRAPERTNFLIVGVDKNESLTDTILVGSLVSSSGNISLLSIPRDTYVELEADKLRQLRENGSSAPSSMKINAINVYGGKKLGIPLLRQEIEEMLGIKLDYYIKVDLSGFESIVDTIGGVYFTVPDGGLYYSDPMQDLYINLQGGYQLLDGEHAQQLVRFRKGYATQDLQRMEVQRQFIQEFVKQLMKKETLLSNLPGLVANFIQYVETDFSITDAAKYFDCIKNITGENMRSETLPGRACMIGNGSYYVCDEDAVKPLVESMFYSSEEDIIEETASEAATLSE